MEAADYRLIPANFGQLTANMLYEYAVYKIYIPSKMIDHYLPDQLLAFPANTQRNAFRRHFYWPVLAAYNTRFALDDYIDQIPNSVSFNYFLEKLSRENDPRIRYNFVIMDDYLIFIRAPLSFDRAHRQLCKHITISSRAKSARFAGEIWSHGHNHFLVSNNSGTYRPLDLLIKPVVQLFKNLAPNVRFQGISFRLSAQPSIK